MAMRKPISLAILFAGIAGAIVTAIATAIATATGGLVVSEVLSDNVTTVVDWRDEHPDWIELHNPDSQPVSIEGWFLTDDPSEPKKWRIPRGVIGSGRYFIVFASGLEGEELQGSRLPHASFKLSADGEYLALVTPDGAIAHALDVRNTAQRADVSFGLVPTADGRALDVDAPPAHLTTPTPGRSNAPPLGGLVEKIELSVPHGFFDKAFPLELSTKTPDAIIRYTTDGTLPTEESGQIANGPLEIGRTTILRAAAFRNGWKQSTTATQTYLFPDDIIKQSPNGEAPDGWPGRSVNQQILDYGMDPEIVTGVESPETIREALRSLPALSVVTAPDNLFDRRKGIYVNPQQKGRSWERPVSFELIDPEGTNSGFQIDAGLRIRGGFSRQPRNPKHAMRLIFRREYGAGKLKYPLFEDEGVESFDFIDLRTSLNYSWAMGGSAANNLLRDVFSRDLQKELGQPYTRSRYYHLFLSGHYWGIYQTQERVTDSYCESYLGGSEEDFDIIKTLGQVAAGNRAAQLRLNAFAVDGFRDDDPYFRVQGLNTDGTRNEDFERLIDIDNLIDYMLIIFYTGNRDGPGGTFTSFPNNYYSAFNRKNPDGFKYFAHDMEHSLDTGLHDMTQSPNGRLTRPEYLNPYSIHMRMVANSNYRKRFKERADMHFFGDGAMTAQKSLARLDRRAAQIEKAIPAHSARWGDASSSRPRTTANWQQAVERSRKWLNGRTSVVLNQLTARGWYDGILPPSFLHGAESNLYATGEKGTIYFTTDGTDPKGADGKPALSAKVALPPTIRNDRVLTANSDLRALVPKNGRDDKRWFLREFDDSNWEQGRSAVGYDDDGDYLSMIQHDVSETLRGKTLTMYARWMFTVEDPDVDVLLLGMKYDDGFAAFLNGRRCLSVAAPQELSWKSAAASKGNDSTGTQWQVFRLPADANRLEKGANVLAIQGLNIQMDSSDFIIFPSIIAQKFEEGTVIANDHREWRRDIARVLAPDGKWSPPSKYNPDAPTPGRELF